MRFLFFSLWGFTLFSISIPLQAHFALINNTQTAYYIKAYAAPRELNKANIHNELLKHMPPEKNAPTICILEPNQQVTLGITKPIKLINIYAYDQVKQKKSQRLYILTIKNSNRFTTIHISTLRQIKQQKITSDILHIQQCSSYTPTWFYSFMYKAKNQEESPLATLSKPTANTYKVISPNSYTTTDLNSAPQQNAIRYFTKQKPYPDPESTIPLSDILERKEPTKDTIFWYWNTVQNKPESQAQELTEKTYTLYKKLHDTVSKIKNRRPDLIPGALERSKINKYFDKLDSIAGSESWHDYYYTQSTPFKTNTIRSALENLADKLHLYAQASLKSDYLFRTP